MNPDLAMGDELLKKTGAGNLFTVFGEPDVKLTTADGKVTVEIRGVDVFDPSTGAVRSGDTDDIACWFIDTDYDGQSFFVRHAYFLYGGKDTKEGPYDKLKKALRAEIDEGEWSKLYTRDEPAVRPADVRQDRREGHQPFRGRSAEGLSRSRQALILGGSRKSGVVLGRRDGRVAFPAGLASRRSTSGVTGLISAAISQGIRPQRDDAFHPYDGSNHRLRAWERHHRLAGFRRARRSQDQPHLHSQPRPAEQELCSHT